MMSGLVVVYLMNWYSCMNNVGLDGLFVHNRLDGFMDMLRACQWLTSCYDNVSYVMYMLAANSWCNTAALRRGIYASLILELSLFLD